MRKSWHRLAAGAAVLSLSLVLSAAAGPRRKKPDPRSRETANPSRSESCGGARRHGMTQL